MFEKLLSVLPYNPNVVQQLGFYSKRMRHESAVRRTGVVFILLAFFVQFFAFVSPPQATIANSSNDIINGGIVSRADGVSKCQNNIQTYRQILDAYGITCDDLAKATTVSLRSTDQNKQLYSMGRLSYGQTNTRTGKPTGETPISVAGVGTFYVRYLWSFDSGAYSTYTALKGTSSVGGKTFYILYNCANPVFIGVPTPKPAPAPAPTPAPTPVTSFTVVKGVKLPTQSTYYKNITAKPGDTVNFSIDIVNTGNTTISPVIRDTLPSGMTYQFGTLANDGKSAVAIITSYNVGSMLPNQFKRITFSAKVPTPASGCTIYTNRVIAQVGTLPTRDSNASVEACKPVVTPTTTPTPTPVPVPVVTPTPTPTPAPTPCVYDLTIPASSPQCKPCDKSVSTTDSLACITERKAASNQTQNLADANNTTAQANDTIVYTLFAENKGKSTIENFIFQDSISDVLDYADIIDLHGGQKTAENAVIWPGVSIEPGKTASVKLTVKVKAEIPTTPNVAGTGRYDHVMTNVYANAINISLPQAPVVQIQTTAAELPKTGPASTLAMAAAVVLAASYFYSRSRLLAYETNLVMRDNNSGGF